MPPSDRHSDRDPALSGGPLPAAPGGFFSRRWRGATPMPTLFWRDMVLVGSLVNLATGAAALVLLAAKAAAWIWIAVWLAPLPYNLFLFGAVWRTAGRMAPAAAGAARLGAGLWLLAALLV